MKAVLKIAILPDYLQRSGPENLSISYPVGAKKYTTIFQQRSRSTAMNLVKVKPKFQVTIPAKLRKDLNLQEGDMLEAIRVEDGILFRVKQLVDRNLVADRIASTLAEAQVPPEDMGRSEDEIMEETIAEISAFRRESHNNET